MREGDLKMRLTASRACTRVIYRIYTCAFRLVASGGDAVSLPAGGGDYAISASRLGGLAGGAYYVLIEAEDNGQNRAKCRIKPILIVSK